MPNAIPVDVAEAVTTMLTTALASQEIVPERSYADWELELTDSNVLHVDVVAVTTEMKTELAARGSLRYLIPIDIGVRQRFGTDKQNDDTGRIPNSELDPLVLLTQQIFELFMPERLTDFEAGVWISTNILAMPIKAHLHQHRQFTAVVRIVFRVEKKLA